MRQCPSCGVLEQRTTDSFGRDTTNLDPITGKCVPCLITSAQQRIADRVMPAVDLPADFKTAQSGERDE